MFFSIPQTAGRPLIVSPAEESQIANRKWQMARWQIAIGDKRLARNVCGNADFFIGLIEPIGLMLSREQKRKLVIELAGILKDNGSFVFADFSGLTMAEMTALKKELKKEGAGFKVLKKSLLDLAAEKSVVDWRVDLSAHRGAVAVAYGPAGVDPGAIAKSLDAFSRVHKKLLILGGYLVGRLMSVKEVSVLAQLPGREALLSQVLAMLMSPVSGLARVLDGIAKRESGSGN